MTSVPLAAPGRLLRDEAIAIDAAVSRVVRSGTWILGREVDGFERSFAAFTGATTTVGCANGTDALILALVAIEPSVGAEVLVPSDDSGFAALAATVAGLRPVVYDIDPRTGAPSVDTLGAVCSAATEVLIVTHLHGDLIDLGAIDEWRRSRGLAMIEDCSQAHGLQGPTGHVGTLADLGTFSFYPTKNLGAVGDGGAVVVGAGSSASSLARRLRALRQYGWVERNRVDLPGGRNSRLDEVQAAILRARLPFLDERNRRRLVLLDHWREALAGSDVVDHVGGPGPTVAHHIVVRFSTSEAREEAARHLDRHGVTTAVHYPWLVHEMSGLRVGGPIPEHAVARRDRVLSLPAEPLLDDTEIGRVADALAGLA